MGPGNEAITKSVLPVQCHLPGSDGKEGGEKREVRKERHWEVSWRCWKEEQQLCGRYRSWEDRELWPEHGQGNG